MSAATDLLTNLQTGLRIATLRAVSRYALVASGRQLVLLVLIACALTALSDYLRVEPARAFSSYGITYHATLYSLLFASLLLAAGVEGRLQTRGLSLVVAYLSATPLLALTWVAAGALLEPWGSSIWIAWGCLALWCLLVFARTLRLCCAPRPARVLIHCLVFGTLNLALPTLLPTHGLWYTDYGPTEETAQTPLDVEATYYAQARLVDRAVRALAAQRPGVTDVYFVGFAPYAQQDVFMSEARKARQLFDDRFDTAGRSLLLINNPETVDTVPLASITNLRWVVKDLARIMDREEDILFLFLTSHGSRDATLSVSFWPLRLNELTASDLAGLLEESGIRWRVLLVSACYSGSFIDALADERTLLMTAAAADRSSFGCTHEREYTYFGEAFFRDQLAEHTSLVGAFRAAAEAVTRREQSEGHEPSLPQIRVGAEIEKKLAEWEARL